VTHVFVSPHPDDAALSCGGLIASLRDRGEGVTIVSVFSRAGDLGSLTPF
jgi:LmbE family N-acetylglucosaminyl deacetylase